MELFQLNELSYTYPGSVDGAPALRHVNIQIKEGEFVLVLGPSGSGKSTLLRALSGFVPEFYGGVIQGDIRFAGRPLVSIPIQELRQQIGMVFQDPERQMVMTEVARELVFGLENLGYDQHTMTRRLLEVLGFLNLESLRFRKTRELSSGEMQKVALGSILATMPRVLILDEPTSQLSPSASSELLSLLGNLHRDYGMTIVLADQELDECFSLCERVLYLDGGSVVIDKSPEHYLTEARALFPHFIPTLAKVFPREKDPVSSMKTLRTRLRKCLLDKKNVAHVSGNGLSGQKASWKASQKACQGAPAPILSLQNVSYRYPSYPFGRNTIDSIDFSVFAGEIVSIVGENGAGKSTLLRLIAGTLQPSSGQIQIQGTVDKRGTVGYLAQDSELYLFHDTVEEELQFTLRNHRIKDESVIDEMLELVRLSSKRGVFPRDLSTGERRRAALASILVTKPKILLLDEPTRGFDGQLKEELQRYLQTFSKDLAMAVLLVTQDIEFAAEVGTRIVLVSDGRILEDGLPQRVFHNNLLYSTSINRLCRGITEEPVINRRDMERVIGSVIHE